MCDSSAYILTDGKETLLLEHIDFIESSGDEVFLIDIFGEEKRIKGRIKSLSLLEHKILFEPL
ncbi:MAG: CooT family nickel-binding protein [Deltaproteobacteria bacterium]|nr:CooT family nickel-binding protein [Deltaproteobacteria bacterium]